MSVKHIIPVLLPVRVGQFSSETLTAPHPLSVCQRYKPRKLRIILSHIGVRLGYHHRPYYTREIRILPLHCGKALEEVKNRTYTYTYIVHRGRCWRCLCRLFSVAANLGKELRVVMYTQSQAPADGPFTHSAKLRVHVHTAPSFGSFTHSAKLLSRRAHGDVTHEGPGRDMDSFVFNPQHCMPQRGCW